MKRSIITLLLIFLFNNNTFAFDFGIGMHSTYYPKEGLFYARMMKSYGFNSFRDEISWASVERKKNNYSIPDERTKTDQLFMYSKEKEGVSSVFILDYGNILHTGGGYPNTYEQVDSFVKYSKWIANRYKGKVKYYEIWNEWELGTGIPHKLHYTKPDDKIFIYLVKETAKAIKIIDPNAIVITGSVGPMNHNDVEWIGNLIDAGIGNYIDGVSVHSYSYNNKNPELRTPQADMEYLDNLESFIRLKSRKTIPIYITEVGIPTNEKFGGVSEELASVYVIKYTLLAKYKPYIKGLWWYDLIDDGNDERNKENRFGFFRRDMTEKKSAFNLRFLKEIIDECTVSKIKNDIAKIRCISGSFDVNWDDERFLNELESGWANLKSH